MIIREVGCVGSQLPGLGVLLKTQKRVMASGQGLRLVNVNKHIRDIFKYAGFDRIFEIVPAGG